MEIQSARDRFFAMVNDLEHNGSSKDTKAPNTKSFKSLFTEYWSQQAIEFVEPATALLPKHECSEISYCLSSSLFPPAQPPDASSLSWSMLFYFIHFIEHNYAQVFFEHVLDPVHHHADDLL